MGLGRSAGNRVHERAPPLSAHWIPRHRTRFHDRIDRRAGAADWSESTDSSRWEVAATLAHAGGVVERTRALGPCSDRICPLDDGLLLAAIVSELDAAHARPFDLALTGPAGRRRTVGADGQTVELDAIEFARTLAGRAAGPGLLEIRIPF